MYRLLPLTTLYVAIGIANGYTYDHIPMHRRLDGQLRDVTFNELEEIAKNKKNKENKHINYSHIVIYLTFLEILKLLLKANEQVFLYFSNFDDASHQRMFSV